METHAILGAGGVGGFVGAVLAFAGARVIVLLRPESFPGYPHALTLESPLGNLSAPVVPALTLEEPVDVLWVTPKATQLGASLGAVPDPGLVRMVVPLLNGVDHVALLRSRFTPERVVPGTIACEVERVAPGRIVHRSSFARLAFAAAGETGLRWAAGRAHPVRLRLPVRAGRAHPALAEAGHAGPHGAQHHRGRVDGG